MAPPVAIIVFDGMQSSKCAAPPTISRSIIVTWAPGRGVGCCLVAGWTAADDDKTVSHGIRLSGRKIARRTALRPGNHQILAPDAENREELPSETNGGRYDASSMSGGNEESLPSAAPPQHPTVNSTPEVASKQSALDVPLKSMTFVLQVASRIPIDLIGQIRSEIRSRHSDLEAGSETDDRVSVAGRVMLARDSGKTHLSHHS